MAFLSQAIVRRFSLRRGRLPEAVIDGMQMDLSIRTICAPDVCKPWIYIVIGWPVRSGRLSVKIFGMDDDDGPAARSIILAGLCS